MSTKKTSQIKGIEKEDITELTFPKNEVLSNEEERAIRKSSILKAMKLGNNLKNKVKIIFEDDTNIYKVETTVWGVTKNNILLKQTTIVPIHRIHEIKLL